MSLEKGGRADKIGNQYENRYLAKLLLRLAEETFSSVEVEPLGTDGKGVEYIAKKSTGEKYFYQCKSSNNIKNYWSVSELDVLKVFEYIQLHIGTNPHNEYHFVSPLPYDELDSLCNRARMNHSAEDFVENQLTNKKLREVFAKCEKYFKLSRKKPEELNRLVFLLSRCYFELVPFGEDTNSDLISMIGHCFVGNASTAMELLENCVNVNGWFGIELTSHQITEYMKENGFPIRNYGLDGRIAPRIQVINETFWETYRPINGSLIHRHATTEIIQNIKEGKSIILHGRAGAGKSGCVEEVVEELKNEQILYLRIKLDKYVPKTIADEYGKSLGLPESPVYCLQKISAGKPCVIILDQLDSLRWTASHSATALAVCKEMIGQVSAINRSNDGSISMLFVTRTFDYKNDSGIKSLFAENNGKNEWKNVELNILTDEETEEAVGEEYNSLSPRLKVLLRTPSTLYIWTQLDKKERYKSITSVDKMMCQWWQQILRKIEDIGLSSESVNSFIAELAEVMNKRGKFSVSKRNYISKSKIIEALISNGLIVEQNEKISFVHQSFLDYFLATESIKKILDGELIVDIIGQRDSQTPNLRYRLLSILRGLMDEDVSLFLEQCRHFIESGDVRYYYKCAIFEAIAQSDILNDELLIFAKEYLSKTEWHSFVYRTIYLGNNFYIENLNPETPLFWMSEEGLNLLFSINRINPDFVVDMLDDFCFKNPEDNQKIFRCLCQDVSDDSEKMYALRTKLFQEQPGLLILGWYSFYDSFKTSPDRCIDYLSHLLRNHSNDAINDVHFPERDELKNFSIDNAEKIVLTLFPLLCEMTKGLAPSADLMLLVSSDRRKWGDEWHSNGHLRKIVMVVKHAMEEYARAYPDSFLELITEIDNPTSLVRNEIVLSGLNELEDTYADNAIKWLLEDFSTRIIDYTGKPTDGLFSVKRIIKRFSSLCSAKLYQELEKIIVTWKDSPESMRRIYKIRLEENKTPGHSPVYYAYWGALQKDLLPELEPERLSTYSENLIACLNRNNWIRKYYKDRIFIGPAKSVASPIDEYAENLPLKTWLKIIKTPSEKMERRHWKETKTSFIEATPSSFSTVLGMVAEKYPNKFAKLALQMPKNCYVGYISSVIRALKANTEQDGYADFGLTCDVIRRFSNINDPYVKRTIAEIVEKRSDEDWPEDIVGIIKTMALTPLDTTCEKEGADAHSLLGIALNSPRGCAVMAMENLLWKHQELLDDSKEFIETLSNDEDDSVRFSLVSCAVCYYNSDPAFSTRIFRHLLEKDIRIFIDIRAWDILVSDYLENQAFYREKLIQACTSKMNDLAEEAAMFLCGVAIFHSDEQALNYILNMKHNNNIAEKFVIQAASTFNKPNFHSVSKLILLKTLENNEVEAGIINKDFFYKNIDLARDHDFLLRLFQCKSGIKRIDSFLKYLIETNADITSLSDIIHEISLHVSHISETYKRKRTIGNLIQCVIKLFDNGKEIPQIKDLCLDIWDQLFKSDLSIVKPLGDMIDHFD